MFLAVKWGTVKDFKKIFLIDESIIRQANIILAQSCSNLLNRIKELLIPKRPGELIDEEDEFTSENLYRNFIIFEINIYDNFSGRLPDDKTKIFELMKASQACFLLLYIKSYLIKLYRLSDSYVLYSNFPIIFDFFQKSQRVQYK